MSLPSCFQSKFFAHWITSKISWVLPFFYGFLQPQEHKIRALLKSGIAYWIISWKCLRNPSSSDLLGFSPREDNPCKWEVPSEIKNERWGHDIPWLQGSCIEHQTVHWAHTQVLEMQPFMLCRGLYLHGQIPTREQWLSYRVECSSPSHCLCSCGFQVSWWCVSEKTLSLFMQIFFSLRYGALQGCFSVSWKKDWVLEAALQNWVLLFLQLKVIWNSLLPIHGHEH